MARKDVEQRVRRVAELALAEQRFVSAIDVLLGLGWLAPSHLNQWRQGRIESLEGVVQANPSKVTTAMVALRGWAQERGLHPSQTDYIARTRDRRQLQFSVSGDAAIERTYRTHWVSPELSQRAIERQSRPPDLVVIWPIEEWTCTSCGGTGDLLLMEDPGPLLRDEADVRFQAEFAAAILAQFPGCPASRAEAIAHHAAVRGSGRIGRSAAGRVLDPDAIWLAVAAWVRHVDTDYDELLMSGFDRETARYQVRDRVDDVLNGWGDGTASSCD